MMTAREDILAVLRVGSGKSTVLLAVAFARPEKLFVVVVPYHALLEHLMRRAENCGPDDKHVPVTMWTGGRPDGGDNRRAMTGILFVSANKAVENDFLAFLRQQATQYETLALITIEEAHLALVAENYRREMAKLRVLRQIEVPLMLLTGTAPAGSSGCTTLRTSWSSEMTATGPTLSTRCAT
jgi:superfamily II DNA helicase RecQ